MLRVHFNTTDLARTSVAPTVNPFWEMVFSRLRLTEPTPPAALRTWAVRARSHGPRLAAGVRVLGALSPLGPYFPDFITPEAGLDGFGAGMDALLHTPRARLHDELAQLAEHRRVPAWAYHLAHGSAPMAGLGGALRTYHETAIEPYATEIDELVGTECARRSADLRDGGADRLLRGMAPLMTWRPPVLETPYGVDRDMYLDGRGLLLVPSYFCRGTPVALADPALTPTLVYPVDQRSYWLSRAHEPLVALLGATRAKVLAAVDDGAGTSEIARRVGTSLAVVSRHTHVLREAGLIETRRRGMAVLHTTTALGLALLSQNCPPPAL